MIGLLADHNIIQQAELIWSVFSPDDWRAMNVGGLLRFADVGLTITANDREVWDLCQTRRLLLLTANRNAKGKDSLAAVIVERNHSLAMPVLTIARANDFAEFEYREDCAYSIADVAARIEQLYGTARLFIP